ncbi:MAG: hypothetical protein JJ863_07515 [Deltaproteobacteria bacterium]|nr:hypothetical protein [Deltaproteobacteria bacterium]
MLVDDWSRWGMACGTIPARLVNEVRTRIWNAAERTMASLPHSRDEWLRDNSVFWPDVEQIPFEELIHHDGPGPLELAETLDALSTDERRVILLHRGEGWSLANVAASLQLDPTEVERLLESAIEKLADVWRTKRDEPME